VEHGDLAVISEPIDFVGLNYYTRAVVRKNPESGWLGGVQVLPAAAPVTDMGWAIAPEHLYHLLTRIGRQWTKLPIYVHENGCATVDVVAADGQVRDTDRIAYIREHLAQGHRIVPSELLTATVRVGTSLWIGRRLNLLLWNRQSESHK
jgi:beta-glucosidase